MDWSLCSGCKLQTKLETFQGLTLQLKKNQFSILPGGEKATLRHFGPGKNV